MVIPWGLILMEKTSAFPAKAESFGQNSGKKPV
jgi:hypothetical protein